MKNNTIFDKLTGLGVDYYIESVCGKFSISFDAEKWVDCDRWSDVVECVSNRIKTIHVSPI